MRIAVGCLEFNEHSPLLDFPGFHAVVGIIDPDKYHHRTFACHPNFRWRECYFKWPTTWFCGTWTSTWKHRRIISRVEWVACLPCNSWKSSRNFSCDIKVILRNSLHAPLDQFNLATYCTFHTVQLFLKFKGYTHSQFINEWNFVIVLYFWNLSWGQI